MVRRESKHRCRKVCKGLGQVTYTGCDIPANQELIEQGWEFRCNTDQTKLADIIDTYKELGHEIRLEPVNLAGLDSNCGCCVELLAKFQAVYTKRP